MLILIRSYRLPITLPAAPLKVPRAVVLVGVVLIRTLAVNVVLVVHLLGLALSLVLGLLAVEEVLALCLRELVLEVGWQVSVRLVRGCEGLTYDFGAGEASEQLLRKLVRYGLACMCQWGTGSGGACTNPLHAGGPRMP
jgi:hypothetical protein